MLLINSVPRQAFDKALQTGTILISLDVLTELNSVFSRKRSDKYLLEEERMRFLVSLIKQAEMIDINEVITACRDPKANKFLELAACGDASCLVTGDLDLLSLHPFRGIPILTPQVFLSSFKNV